MKPPQKKWRLAVVVLIAGVGFLVLRILAGNRETAEQQADALYQQAKLSLAKGESREAEKLARQAVELDAKLDAAWLLIARIEVSQEAYRAALQDLSNISANTGEEGYAARQLTAEILHKRLHRLREAEQAYRRILREHPDDVVANEGLVWILGLCGRRQEAIPHVLRLIRAGQGTDFLIFLSREAGALYDPQMLKAARETDPDDPNPILGLAQVAASEQDPARALKLLREAAQFDGLPEVFYGRMGRQLLADGQFDELERWISEIPTPPESFESWMLLGELAERADDQRGAIRCYWEAVKLCPESREAITQLAQSLTSQNQDHLAEPFLRRLHELNVLRNRQHAAITSDDSPEIEKVVELVRGYQAVGRLWEALAWSRWASAAKPDDPELLQIADELSPQIPDLALELTAAEFNPAYQIDLSHFPVPRFSLPSIHDQSSSVSTSISFARQAAEIGFDFQYYDGTSGTTYRMFEFAGGGIAVLDFDNDGAPDIFCTQGREWDTSAPTTEAHFDRLFHNRQGKSFLDVTSFAGVASETGFGQGVSAGDVNNDGFADLYVANTGKNTLWLNNGDGTFSDHSAALTYQSERWTTSCLIADLNGDSVPDLYDVNYLAGEDVFDRLCANEEGRAEMCKPTVFAPAGDRVRLGTGEGGFLDQTDRFLSPPPDGKGLGIAAMNIGDGRLSLFIANDTTANFFYTFDSPSETSMTDTALLSGLAFNDEGRVEACMGVAVGDCTGDGRLDLLVTNFLYESNTLYTPVDRRLFRDRTREAGLHAATLPVLGFGTQFLDANLDGRLELFIANGFTHDSSQHGTPYKMDFQVFEWTGKRFEQLEKQQLGPWSRTKAVGRAVARLDWNLDRRPDLAVGLLDAPTFLLTNTSSTRGNHVLTLQLAATGSARDAVGTIVTASVGETTWVHQLTAGDGYQCTNERKLHIGCGASAQIDRLTVEWPSGRKQEFSALPVSQSYILVEGHSLLPGLPP